MKKILTLLLLGISFTVFSQGTQPAPKASANLDVSNINPKIQTGGDAFWDLMNPGFEVPRGSGKHTVFAGALWLGGKDQQNNLYVAAQTYRQSNQSGVYDAGYWPGPIGIVQDSLHSVKYDKVWKVSQVQIEDHITNYNNPYYNIPDDILTWPGNGNLANGEAKNLAPFIDVNQDGIYSPTLGDYPDIKGDQALYVIFNDRGNIKEPLSPPMNIEVHAMHYGFDDQSNVPVYNTLFSEYRIINRGQNNFQDFYVGLWTDFDIGSMLDDFVGCDTLTNRYFGYNGDNFDEGITGYGSTPPVQSVTILNQTLNHFMYYNNDQHRVNGNPNIASDFYNYLTGKWKDGTNLTYGGDGTNQQNKAVSYMFPGDPVTLNGWSEVNNFSTKPNIPADRRGLGSFGPFILTAGQEITFTTASTFSRGSSNMNSVVLAGNDARAVQHFFNTQSLKPKPAPVKQEMVLYPNPAGNNLQIQLPNSLKYNQATFTITDCTGRLVFKTTAITGSKTHSLDISSLKKGFYQVNITTESQALSSRLVKL